MDFAQAWHVLAIGDAVTVSDGLPPPPVQGSATWWIWRSHNFTGRLTEKSGEAPHRVMRVELKPEGGATVTYEVQEALAHSFALSGSDASDNG